MDMNKDLGFEQKGYTADAVIRRGYEICDEWEANKPSSRSVVAQVERAVSATRQKQKKAAAVEALACLFALDMRIEKKYSSLLVRLFFYRSWRRETQALKLFKNTLRISESETDIRNAIEVTLQRLRERIEAEETDEEDDQTHGGKRNGKAEEEAVAEEKGEEQASEEKTEETAEAEEAAEEKTEEGSKETQAEETVKDGAEQKSVEEATLEETETVLVEQQDPLEQEALTEVEVENNASDVTSEPSTDKKEEARTYNDAVDSPPLFEDSFNTKSAEKRSFIDEVIMDNMVKGKEDFIRHDPLEDVQQDRESDRQQDANANRNEENKSTDKDAYLYDRFAMRGEKTDAPAQTNEKTPEQKPEQKPDQKTEQKSEQKPEQKTEQPSAPKVNDTAAEAIKQDFENIRVPIQVDIGLDQENEMRRELSLSMTSEQVSAIRERQIELMREQMRIAELEMDAPTEIVGKAEAAETALPTVEMNRK